MVTTLDSRRHSHPDPGPGPGPDRTEREPVVLADALGDVMAALTDVDPDLVVVHGSDTRAHPATRNP